MNWGQRALDRLPDIARCSVDGTGVTRLPYTSEHKAAVKVIRLWIIQVGQTAPCLPSGATHDASAMADLYPTAMLFVRCKDGHSHKPEEFASANDIGAAIQAICSHTGEHEDTGRIAGFPERPERCLFQAPHGRH
jgi:acetylornithine deacetylase/succinyl-diaminopimelate desuccinylase-like protein